MKSVALMFHVVWWHPAEGAALEPQRCTRCANGVSKGGDDGQCCKPASPSNPCCVVSMSSFAWLCAVQSSEEVVDALVRKRPEPNLGMMTPLMPSHSHKGAEAKFAKLLHLMRHILHGGGRDGASVCYNAMFSVWDVLGGRGDADLSHCGTAIAAVINLDAFCGVVKPAHSSHRIANSPQCLLWLIVAMFATRVAFTEP